jgi:gliding motility-associated-like protein
MLKIFFCLFAVLVCYSAAHAQVSADSLALYLPFNGDANDYSGNNYNGIVKGATLTTGFNNQPNGAYYFDGYGSIVIPNLKKLDGTLGAYTVLVRMQSDGHTANTSQPVYTFFSWQYDLPSANDAFFNSRLVEGWQAESDNFSSKTNFLILSTFCDPFPQVLGGYGYLKDTGDVYNTWVTLAYVYDHGTIKVFNDCKLEYTDSRDFPKMSDMCKSGNVQVVLGLGVPPLVSGQKGDWNNFEGKIDELRIYTRALSDSEVYAYAAPTCNQVIVKQAILCAVNPCQPNEFTFKDSSIARNLVVERRVWKISNGDSVVNADSFTYRFTNTGNYTVQENIYSGTSVYSGNVAIKVSSLKPPKFITTGDTLLFVCENSPVQLHVSGGVSYYWQPCNYLSECASANPVITTGNNIKYMVTAVDSNKCRDSIVINVQKIPDQNNVFVPTAFTPNADGYNDTWGITSTRPLANFNLQVYNRWGQMVFASQNQGTKWDGATKHQPAPPGTYVWVLMYKNGNGCNSLKTKGVVLLIR